MRDIVMVVGSGMMGSGIGAMSALAGNKTVLVDTSAERAENGRKKIFRHGGIQASKPDSLCRPACGIWVLLLCVLFEFAQAGADGLFVNAGKGQA